MQVTCNVSNSPNCNAPDSRSKDDSLLKDMRYNLQNRLTDNDRADILGNIIVLHPQNDAPSDVIEASIPQEVIEKDQESFLLVSMNLVRFRRLTTAVAIAAASCIGLATLLLAYFVGVESKRSRDYREAFARVAQVMAESPTPYVRLDSADMITDFSGSFINLIGLRPENAQQASCTEFRSLLADEESRRTYDDVEGRRRRREKVDPYHVTLKRKDGNVVRVRIVSATVPASAGGEMPETFGLLLTQSEEDLVPIDFVDAAKRSLHDRP
jgi:PAS domain S-box-containing protein